MKRIRLQSILILGALLTAGCARIGPDETGVRTKNFGKDKGIVSKDQGPGYHRFLWPLDSWQRFPSTVQSIRFTQQRDLTSAGATGPIELTSVDGDRVVIAAEVLFHIAEGAAHKVLQDSGSGERYREVAGGLAQDAARALFGRLRTEEFYNVARREKMRGELMLLLRRRLGARDIELVDFLLESIEFPPNYEALIKTKKVADQKVDLEKAKSRAAEERGKVTLVRTQTDLRLAAMQKEADIAMMKQRTDTDLKAAGFNVGATQYAAERTADGAHYQGLKHAEGIRVTKAAEAASTQLINEALVGNGGRNLVARETVKGLNLPEMVIPSDGYPWLSPREMVRRLGGEDEPATAERGAAAP